MKDNFSSSLTENESEKSSTVAKSETLFPLSFFTISFRFFDKMPAPQKQASRSTLLKSLARFLLERISGIFFPLAAMILRISVSVPITSVELSRKTNLFCVFWRLPSSQVNPSNPSNLEIVIFSFFFTESIISGMSKDPIKI